MVEKAFLSVYQFLIQRKLFFILFLGALLFLLGLGVSRLKVSQDINSILPQGNGFDAFQKIVDNKALNDKVFFRLDISEHNFSEEKLLSFSNQLKEKSNEKLVGITLFKDDIQQDIYNYYLDAFPILIDSSYFKFIDDKTSVDSISAGVQNTYRQFVSPNAAFLKTYLRQDPIGISGKYLKSLENIGANQPYEIDNSIMYAKDGSAVLAYATINCKDNVEKEELYFMLEQFKSEWNGSQEMSLDYFGTFQIHVENSLQVKADTFLTLIITIVAILLILILYYRKITIPLFFILPTAFSALFALGFIGFVKPEISGLSLATGAVLFGIVLDYSFHFFTHLRHTKSIEETLKEISIPLLTGSLTTILAFAALLFANSKILQDFGLFASFALLGATLFTVILLPAILKLVRFNLNSIPEGKSYFKIPKLNKKYNFPVLIVIAGITAFFYHYSNQVTFDSDLLNLSFHQSQLKEKENQFVGLNPDKESKLFVFATGENLQEAAESNYSLYQRLKTLQSQGLLNSFNSTGDFLIPENIKAKRFERWQNYWNTKTDLVITQVEKESDALGFNPKIFDPFKNWLTNNTAPSFDSTLLVKMELDQLISKDENGAYNIISTLVIPKENIEEVSQTIEAINGITIFNKASLANTLVEQVKDDFNYLLLVSALIVFIALLLIYGRIELAFIAFLPMVISWVWILGAAALLGIQFNFVNIVIATFIFGLGDDFSIFVTDGLLTKYRVKKNSLSSFKAAIVLSAITTIIGTGVLGVAKHPAIHSIALISVLGIVCILLISLVVQPILFNLLIQNRVDKEKSPITFLELFITSYCFLFFFVGCITLMTITLLLYIIPAKKLAKRNFLNFLVSKFAYAQLRIGFHVKMKVIDLDRLIIKKPSVIIANHSSFLDILLLLMLNPKIVLMVKDWVYNSPFFGFIIRFAGYLFTGHGAETNLDKAKKLVKQGYSIAIFPEGTRSEHGKLGRFHKGGFLLAQELNLDITPVMIYGADHVLNKKDFLIKRGTLSVKVLPRIEAAETSWGVTYRERSKAISKDYKQQYAKFISEQNSEYHIFNRIFQNYLFKGPLLEWYFKVKWGFEKKNYAQYDELLGNRTNIIDAGCGYGYLSYYLHYRNPERKLLGYDYDEEKIDIAKHAFDLSDNVQFKASDIADVAFRECDAIFFNDVLHYLGEKEQKALIREAAEALTPDGLMIIRDGITDLGERHETTIKSEHFSTNILKFNKKTRDFSFFTSDFVKKLAQENKMSFSMVEQSQKTSNVLFILKKEIN